MLIIYALSYGSNKNLDPLEVMASSVVLSMGGSYSPLTRQGRDFLLLLHFYF